MKCDKPHQGRRAPTTGYSHAAKTALQETTRRVSEMHQAIAGKSFDLLRRIPLVAGPAQLVRSVHDAIAAGVYAAIHHAGGSLLDAAAIVERHYPRRTGAATPPGKLASGLRSALNGAFGDYLVSTDSRLAIDMAIHAGGVALPLTADALRVAFPDAGRRLCLFVHGLACDEHGWDPGDAAATSPVHFGRRLREEFSYTPLYLRYNSGLPIARNGAHLAALLEELMAVWPVPVGDLVVIGHSMGGLVALAACEAAAQAGLGWPRATRMLICLGSPHLGSALERLGELTNALLDRSAVTAPLGRIAAARSQGIKDLGQGPGSPTMSPGHAHIAFRFLGASLTDKLEHPIGRFLGDGLVSLRSATGHAIDGDVQSAQLGGLGHLALLNDPRVYRQISEWVGALPRSGSALGT
ncbi:triacylglycerol lipase [Accumulibacter sp.]|uniref:esterase/lipase family protein n=1 Tax=Accumulibacter sp. TaxID=2053492 RepID=UPI002628F0C5|nr:alpha/beta fold hydrolase [Accumulibacter sp.]